MQANVPAVDGTLVRDALRTIVPDGVHLSVWDATLTADLYPVEQEFLVRAVASRREEFRRGRTVARAALAAAGAPLTAIPVGRDRQPIWPAGFTGSITHTTGLVAAIAAQAGVVRALGLDAELLQPLPNDVRASVLHPCEEHVDPVHETVVFSEIGRAHV